MKLLEQGAVTDTYSSILAQDKGGQHCSLLAIYSIVVLFSDLDTFLRQLRVKTGLLAFEGERVTYRWKDFSVCGRSNREDWGREQ
jgi:hypothetical protein